ncbi:Cff1p NDAI_0D03220 [Naumovozyma dairenensis CBS 421]|uniref:DUF985 domain-containing protein n=1 Tax=Naumovozyma dairenensis (strain ATCC 10597 / BCRC 20456 / CBS 421 / NBRC 0211 / NRRL Y-12639) TaxID=1071378 RepID=G0WA25_NAUDC|nr:hypothetical protein NDAI_0D03220 [Naumovozyma dairenensis CBS 421]CCD24636.1 hypothetical protein NDAI_0D03220 [Naumovozyma dairenensis CBS 421]
MNEEKICLESATIDSVREYPIDNLASFVQVPASEPPTKLKELIDTWGLIKHGEGGYFKETDRSPFVMDAPTKITKKGSWEEEETTKLVLLKRNYSTLIYYLLTPDSPIGKMHKNRNRIIHILQRGKGQYVLIYPNGQVKSFRVGFDYANGEVSQWVVPGGVYKASFLVPNEEFHNGLLISEVVVPGFDFEDHLFMSGYDEMVNLLGEEKAASLKFLL